MKRSNDNVSNNDCGSGVIARIINNFKIDRLLKKHYLVILISSYNKDNYDKDKNDQFNYDIFCGYYSVKYIR